MDGGTREENDESRSRGGRPTTRNEEQLGEGLISGLVDISSEHEGRESKRKPTRQL